jgi:hypothetical protein
MLEYNKEKTAALLKEGHEITRHLKVEVMVSHDRSHGYSMAVRTSR